jgi:hypothetical protein
MKTLFAIFFVLGGLTAFSQDEPAENNKPGVDPEARERIKAARLAYITERLELTTTEFEKFLPVYREYSEKREAIHLKMKAARESNKDDNSLLQLYHQVRQEELDLEKSFSPKFLQVISAEKLLKLHESEKEFRKLVTKHAMKRGNKAEGRKKQMKQRR